MRQKIVFSDRVKIVYEIVFALLAIVTVSISFFDILEKIDLNNHSRLLLIDNTINVIFIIDYFTRFFLAEKKSVFFRKNIPDFIAILPFNALFKALRIVKLFRVLKLAKLAKVFRFFALIVRVHKRLKAVLHSHGLIYSIWFACFIILLGAVGIFFAEKGESIKTFQDAVWWAFVTTTTVGYGDISPSGHIGRFIAAILMITGIGTIGMVTSSISVYFIQQASSSKEVEADGLCEPEKVYEELKTLNHEEVLEVLNYIDYIKTKR